MILAHFMHANSIAATMTHQPSTQTLSHNGGRTQTAAQQLFPVESSPFNHHISNSGGGGGAGSIHLLELGVVNGAPSRSTAMAIECSQKEGGGGGVSPHTGSSRYSAADLLDYTAMCDTMGPASDVGPNSNGQLNFCVFNALFRLFLSLISAQFFHNYNGINQYHTRSIHMFQN